MSSLLGAFLEFSASMFDEVYWLICCGVSF